MSIVQNERNTLVLVGILILLIGFLIGWLGFVFFGNAAKLTNVLFISKDAVLSLEELRFKNGADPESTFFFGASEKTVLQRLMQIAKALENRNTKVLFVSSNTGNALGGMPISDLVHEELLKLIAQEKKIQNNKAN